MRRNYKNIVIMSAHLASRSDADNVKRHRGLIVGLESIQIPFTEVMGVYKGISEKSVMIVISGTTQLKQVRHMAHMFEQESILERDNENQARLVFMNGDTTLNLGEMRQITKEVAALTDCYTYVPSTNEYYKAGY